MPRSRVLSFMSQFGGPPRSPTADSPPSPTKGKEHIADDRPLSRQKLNIDTTTAQAQGAGARADQFTKQPPQSPHSPTPLSRARADSRAATRPNSMIQGYQPPQVEVAADTPPELQPIFSFLNSHSNKLYQEGYFLKLHDLDSRGRPSPDRVWVECFAQLVGTVLSLWDAAALDAAGEDGEVVPTFINLSDASIKMIESLPMNSAQGGSLQNVLSISTAANNRYLLHFNSLNSLTQWTAGIRLAMFEHATLMEAYTGSLIAGKGKTLNNIRAIMDRSRFPYEDWVRVRFGAGTAWKRCWCVVTPPDEKQYNKAQKTLKKTSTYERARVPKGDIKFYDTRRVTKKTMPIATITDAYAAYAIYPQSKPLIDQSTLVKLEGVVTLHGSTDSVTEGFVFIMPEVHPAVTGFEMMLRFLFPVFDTFALYGRPNRLIADTLDQKGLMFAMPRDRRYGYLDILDVSNLIHTDGSQAWTERQWRREMKKLTSTRMMTQMENSPRTSQQLAYRRNAASNRASMPPTRGGVRFEDGAPLSAPGSRSESPAPVLGADGRSSTPPRRTDSAPPAALASSHKRSVSDAQGHRRYETQTPSRLSYEASRGDDEPPPPPRHGGALGASLNNRYRGPSLLDRIQSENEAPTMGSFAGSRQPEATSAYMLPPEPVVSPPALQHSPYSRPPTQPYQAPELRRAHSNVDAATLYQMQDAVRRGDVSEEDGWHGEVQYRHQQSQYPVATTPTTSTLAVHADASQGLLSAGKPRDPRQRLSTIIGSPSIDDSAGSFQPVHNTEGAETVANNEQTGAGLTATANMPNVVPLAPHHSIARKPVPSKSADHPLSVATSFAERNGPEQRYEAAASSPDSPINPESWAGDVIDQDVLERVLNGETGSRSETMQSSEPDYASTASSNHEKPEPVEKPRAGRLKTVGDPTYTDTHQRSGSSGKLDTWARDQAEQKAGVPSIDFGPTLVYKLTGRPTTSGTITPGELEGRRRSRSGDRLTEVAGGPSPPSPEARRQSYFGGRTTPGPAANIVDGSPARTPSQSSIVWQPALASPGGTLQNRQSLTPEQWVQYRAAMAAQPQQVPPRRPTPNLAHHRSTSGQSLHQLRKTPPFSRPPSGDWTQVAAPGDQRTPPSRPQSRGTGALLGPGSPGTVMNTAQPTNLTAKEQMHVARATGMPLVSYTTKADQKKQEEQQPGLFGALAAREREKEESKKAGSRHSMSNPMVQQAIATRQQQQQMQAEAQAQAQYQWQMQQHATQQAQMMQMQYQQMMMAQQQAAIGHGGSQYQMYAGPEGQGYGMGSPVATQRPQAQPVRAFGQGMTQQLGMGSNHGVQRSEGATRWWNGAARG